MPQVLRVGNPKKRRIAGDVVTDLKTLRASVLTRGPAAGDPQRAGKAWQYLQSPGRQASGLTYENSPDYTQWRWEDPLTVGGIVPWLGPQPMQ